MKHVLHKVFVLLNTNVTPKTHSKNWDQFLANPKGGDLSPDPGKISYTSKESKGLANICGSDLGSFRHGSDLGSFRHGSEGAGMAEYKTG